MRARLAKLTVIGSAALAAWSLLPQNPVVYIFLVAGSVAVVLRSYDWWATPLE